MKAARHPTFAASNLASKKATHARQVRHELGIVRLSPKRHRIKSIDEIAARLKLCRLKEELRDVYPIALGRISCAVVDGAGPAGESVRIGFAAQKVYVLLAHEEVGLINRIHAVTDAFVVLDGHGGGRLRAQGGAAGAVETDGESFVAFGVSVIDDGDRESLRRRITIPDAGISLTRSGDTTSSASDQLCHERRLSLTNCDVINHISFTALRLREHHRHCDL